MNPQTPRKLEEPKLVARRLIAGTTDQREQPSITFNLEENAAAFLVRWRRLHVRALPTAIEIFGNVVHPAGIREMRIHTGPGYRVYFVQKKQVILLLLCGGSKASQARDIARAKKIAQELKDNDNG